MVLVHLFVSLKSEFLCGLILKLLFDNLNFCLWWFINCNMCLYSVASIISIRFIMLLQAFFWLHSIDQLYHLSILGISIILVFCQPLAEKKRECLPSGFYYSINVSCSHFYVKITNSSLTSFVTHSFIEWSHSIIRWRQVLINIF